MNEEVKKITPDDDIEVKILEKEKPQEEPSVNLESLKEEEKEEVAPKEDLEQTVESLKGELAQIKKEPYSDRVKNRIAKEVSRRKAEEDKSRALEERLAKLETSATTQTKNDLDLQYQNVSKNLKEAIEGGDTEKQVKLMDEMADVRSQIKSVQETPAVKTETKTPEIPHLAKEWIEKNSNWWNKAGHRAATQLAFGVDADLTEEGYDMADPEYYIEMDKRMGKFYPDLIKSEENTSNGEQKELKSKVKAQSPVAGVSRSSQNSAKSVMLTKDDLQNAITFGININDPAALKRYARELANYEATDTGA
jgi:hypothetical protein